MSGGSPRYPLRAAQQLRQSATERAKLRLQRERAALVQAERELALARAAFEQQRAAQHAAAADAAHGQTGPALELQRAAAFAARQAEATRAARTQLDAAEAVVAERRAALTQGQQALSATHAAEQVLERDAQRFAQRERKQREVLEMREHEAPRRR